MERPATQEPVRGSPSGARSGALMAAASLVGIVLNYTFLLAAGRFLGPEDYGALAALVGLLTVVLLPTGAIQMAVSRDVARHLSSGDPGGAAAFVRTVVRLGAFVTPPLVALGLVLAVPVGMLLDIDAEIVALAATGLATAVVLPASLGVVQGYERFRVLAALYVFPFALRLAILGGVVAVGLRLGGAVLATVAAVAVTAAVALLAIRQPLQRGAARARPPLAAFVRYLLPVTVGLVGIAVLTNVDVLVVRARFPAEDAGVYAAASAFARVAFFLPATVLAVLFPRTAARQARGQQTDDILGRALLVTGAFAGLLVVGYWLTGEGLVVSSFGAEFRAGGALLPAYAVAMGLYSLANVLVGYHLSRGETRYAWLVAGGIPLQLALLALVPGSLEGVIWANASFAAVLLVAHELVVGSSRHALRAGARHLIPAPLARRLRAGAREAGIATLAYGALAVVVTWPLAAGFGSTFIGDERNDAAGTIAWLWRLGEEGGYHLFGATTHTLTGAPFGWEEGNALNLQWLLAYYPAYLLSTVVGEVAAYNAVILSGLVLSALSMYALARYLGCAPLVAGWAGVALMLLPWVVWRINAGHASLVHLEALVLVVLALAFWASRPGLARAALVGGAVTAAWLTSGYFGVMAVIGAVAFVLLATAVRREPGARARLREAAVATAAVALGTVVVGLASIPGRVEGGASIPRDVSSLSVYGAHPAELVVPPRRHPVLGSPLEGVRPDRYAGPNAESALYVGLLTLALAVGWIAVAVRRRRLDATRAAVGAGLAGVGVAGFAFALASPLVVAGVELRMPSWLLFQVLPEARVPSRFTALLAVALIALAALGLQALVDRARRSAIGVEGLRRGQLVLVLALGVTLFELLPSLGKPLDADAVPAPYAALSGTPQGVLAEYPLGPPWRNTSLEYALRQRVHGRPLLNGARAGSLPDEVRRTLVDPFAEGTAEALALLGVPSIVTRGNGLGYVNGLPVDRTARLGEGYELVGRFDDGYAVWRVTAPPAPALAVLPGADFEAPRARRGGFVPVPLKRDEAEVELRATESGVRLLTFDVEAPGASLLTVSGAAGATEVALDGRTTVEVPVLVPRGVSRLQLRIRPRGSRAGAAVVSPPRAVRTDRAPELRAALVSGDPGF